MYSTAILDPAFSILRFIISDLKNPRVTIPKQVRAKLLKFHQKSMYLTAILEYIGIGIKIYLNNDRVLELLF